jgi:outer membrane protein, heavy metal efflux system
MDSHTLRWVASAFAIGVLNTSVLLGQSASLSLPSARQLARAQSPELTAAREAVAAAIGRERQASVRLNPTLGFSREQTSGGGQSNAQNILGVDQTIELPGLRDARRDAGRARREAAEARVSAVEAQLDYDVARAYAVALTADRRAALAADAARAFAAAVVVSDRRLREGDISGFAARRIRLEAVRYATLEAEAVLARRTARLTLASLLATNADSLRLFDGVLSDSTVTQLVAYSPDSVVARALATRSELRAATFEIAAAEADARLAARERTPSPTLSAGLKSESSTGTSRMNGFVAGLSLPIALFDRREGSIAAADAEARRRAAELEVLRRRIAREAIESVEALRAIQGQIQLLSTQFVNDATTALRSAQTAYAEGEITLLEWLDTVRAYQEAETSLTTLRSEYLIRAAAVERAAGIPLLRGTR